MRSVEERRNSDNREVAWLIVMWLLAAIGMWLNQGCATTVVPQPVEAREASFDGNEQTSGVLSATDAGFVVTARFRERFNALAAIYGRAFTPPLVAEAGVTRVSEDRWLVSRQAMVQFLEMNSWRRAGLTPKNP